MAKEEELVRCEEGAQGGQVGECRWSGGADVEIASEAGDAAQSAWRSLGRLVWGHKEVAPRHVELILEAAAS